MKCGIVNCAQNDNRFLLRCQGTCKRIYHAACIGVQRNHEDVLRTFMLPPCQDCQEKFTPELNLNVLSTSFQSITESIGPTLAANHKLITNFKTLSAAHDEALDRIEKMLGEIKHNISNATTSSRNSAVEIKTKLSALLDTPPADPCMAVEKAVNSAATAAMEAITTTTKTATAHSIDLLPKLIAELRNDLVDSNDTLASDIKSHMEEIAKQMSGPDVRKCTPTPNARICNTIHNISLANELQNIIEPTPGWRILGNKRVWKDDWNEYDAKQHARRLQEKNEEKARRRRKQRKQHHQETNKNNNNNNNHNNNNNNNNNNNDKNLLAMAKAQFAGPPSTIDHPVAGLSILAAKSSFINFQKGETINPYRSIELSESSPTNTTIQPQQNPNMLQRASCSQEVNSEFLPPTMNRNSHFELDPLRPPIVRLTEQSVEGDGRMLKARLRDPKILKMVRLYLAYMKDQHTSVCIEGMTATNIRMLLSSEGLPTAPDHLHRIFTEVHEEYGLSAAEATADLQAYGNFLSSERTHRLQQVRESSTKFYTSGSHFRK